MIKKALFILFLFSFSTNIFSQQKRLGYQNDQLLNNLGIGVLQQINVNEKIIYYSDSLCSKPINVKYKIPVFYKKDYGILFYICLKASEKYYKILISDKNPVFIKKRESLNFFTWDAFLKDEITGIDSKNLKEIYPRNSVNGEKIDIRKWSDDDEEEVLEVIGEWIKLKNTTQNVTFWIQWKNKDKLTIYLNLLM